MIPKCNRSYLDTGVHANVGIASIIAMHSSLSGALDLHRLAQGLQEFDEPLAGWTDERRLARGNWSGFRGHAVHGSHSGLQFLSYLLDLLGDLFQRFLGFFKPFFRVFPSQLMMEVSRCAEEISGYLSSRAVIPV